MGKLYAAQEERFTKLKNDYGFPKNAIENCIKYTQLNGIHISCALGTNFLNRTI